MWGEDEMKKALEAIGVFLSFVFLMFGIAVMMVMNLEVVSRPMDPGLHGWTVYYLDFRSSPIWFYIGCGIVSASLTFFWWKGRK